ncbi:MAG: hypothetical protein JZU65_23925 [Chlorobium sp.]|nr:hypothetical protein [Chlorobium sp.]
MTTKNHSKNFISRQAYEAMGMTFQPSSGVPDNSFGIELFNRDLKVKRPSVNTAKARGDRTKIFSFSCSSQLNLLHTCRNSGHHIVSQFTCTYHEVWPENGVAIKKHMDVFRHRLTRKFGKDIHFIWCLEFQQRGAPHFHFFSDLEVTPAVHSFLATSWVEVSKGTPQSLKFHNHPSCFIPWSMKSGAYLAKEYIGKVEQKQVPENFQDVGRFWGASRNMKPQSSLLYFDMQVLEVIKAVNRTLRIVTKHQEKKLCDIKRKTQAIRRDRLQIPGKASPIKPICLRTKRQSVTLHHLTPMFLTILSAAVVAVGKLPIFC